MEAKTGTSTGQEPGGRSLPQGHGAVLITGLLLMPCSTCFLMEPRTTSPGMAPPTMGWALFFHESVIKKMPYRLAENPDLMEAFSQLRFILFG